MVMGLSTSADFGGGMVGSRDSAGVRAWEGDVKPFVVKGRFRNWRLK
jgi:hypothetical protein